METYKTSEVAKLVGFHPNTIRRYEEWKLIPKPQRAKNGYRIYNEYHVELIRTAKVAFQVEVLQSGLRAMMRELIKALAKYEFASATALLHDYVLAIDQEIDEANEAIHIVEDMIKGTTEEEDISLKRSEAAKYIGVTTDALRNWELNGLLLLKRSENGYRIYAADDLKRLKIIRILRSAKYSLEAILRLLHSIDHQEEHDVRTILNNPEPSEDIISVCDMLILSLEKAKMNTAELAK
ncbi:MerR family transcriptional regulator, partial [Listeria monocytogenes]|nr:MerR family transcriptional regulator [Listeria monocytogenes]